MTIGVRALIQNAATDDDSVARNAPLSGEVSGDLVIFEVEARASGATLSMVNTGGQTWNSGTQRTSGASVVRKWWARFNGTWTNTPSFQTDTKTGVPLLIGRVAYIPTSPSNTWASAVGETSDNVSAPTGPPYNVTTIAPGAPGATSTVTHTCFYSNDDNTWALGAGGYSNPGGVTQIKNTVGSDASLSVAYKVLGTNVDPGSCTNEQTANGPDSGRWTTEIFKEVTAASTPEFSSGPVQSAQTTSSLTYSGTPTQAATWYMAAVPKGATAPTKAQVKAGTGGGIVAAANKAVTGADTHGLTGLTKWTYDVYHVLNNANGDSALYSTLAAVVAAGTGKQFKTLNLASGIFPYSIIYGASPAAATGDMLRGPLLTPDGRTVVIEDDGRAWYAGTVDDENRQILTFEWYDLSADVISSPVDSSYNNKAPAPESSTVEGDFPVGVAGPTYPLGGFFNDIEGDTLSFALAPSSPGFPAWAAIVGTNLVISAPGTVDDVTVTIRASDPYQGVGDLNFRLRSLAMVLVITVVKQAQGFGTTLLEDAGFVANPIPAASSVIPAGYIIRQNPRGKTLAPFGSTVDIYVSDPTLVTPSVKGRLGPYFRRGGR